MITVVIFINHKVISTITVVLFINHKIISNMEQ